jgi:hypothetical protein
MTYTMAAGAVLAARYARQMSRPMTRLGLWLQVGGYIMAVAYALVRFVAVVLAYLRIQPAADRTDTSVIYLFSAAFVLIAVGACVPALGMVRRQKPAEEQV